MHFHGIGTTRRVVGALCATAIAVLAIALPAGALAGHHPEVRLKGAAHGLLACLRGHWVSTGFTDPGFQVSGGSGATFDFSRSGQNLPVDLIWTLGYNHMSDVVASKDGTTVRIRFRGSMNGGLIQDADGVLSYLGDHDVSIEVGVDGGPLKPVSGSSQNYGENREWDELECSGNRLTAVELATTTSFKFKRVGKAKKSLARAAAVPGAKDPCKLVSQAQVHAATGVPVSRGHVNNHLGPTPICQFALSDVSPPGQTDAVQINDFAYNANPSTLKYTLGPHYKRVEVRGHRGLCGVKEVASNAPLEGTLLLSAPAGDSLEVVADATDGRNACSISEKIAGDAARHL